MNRTFQPPPEVQLVAPNRFVRKDVVDVKKRLVDALETRQPATVLIGAGCSVSGGILGAAGICKRIFEDYPDAYDWACEKDAGGLAPTYNQCMHRLSSSGQRQLFSTLIEGSHVNWGHFALACLMKEGYVGRVMTTNFDNLLVRACALLDYFPGTYDMAVYRGQDGHENSNFQWSEVEKDAIFYLHGQATGFRLLSDNESLSAHAKHIGDCFPFKNSNSPWLVVGYSGGTDPLFQVHISQPTTFPANLFWVSYLDSGVHPDVDAKLFTDARGAYHVEGYDSDTFFVELAQELGVLNQMLLEQPKEHLLSMLTALGPVPFRDGRGPIFEIKLTLEQLGAPIIKAGAHSIKNKKRIKPKKSLAMIFQGLLVNGEYEEVKCQFEALSSEEQALHRDAAAKAYFGIGDAIYWDLRRNRDTVTAKRWLECVHYHERACQLDSGNEKLLLDTCITLYELGRVIDVDHRRATFQAAVSKAEEAYALKSRDKDILTSWSIALYELGRVAEPNERRSILEDAVRRAEEAYAVDGEDPEILMSWCISLTDLGRVVKLDEKQKIFRESADKAEQAHRLDPQNVTILLSWCISLYELGRVVVFEKKEDVFRTAVCKAEQGHNLAPQNTTMFMSWCIALCELGRIVEFKEKEEIFNQAVEKVESLIAAGAKSIYVWAWLGTALTELGRFKVGKDQENEFRKAEEALLRSEEVNPGYGDWFYAGLLALMGQSERCHEWLKLAKERGYGPKRYRIAEDERFNSVREEDWYKDYFNGLDD